jgi:hypothetical protein
MRLFHREPLQLIVAQEILPGEKQRPQHALEKILGPGYEITVAVGNAAVEQLAQRPGYAAAVLAARETTPHFTHSNHTRTTGLEAVLRMRENGITIPAFVIGQDIGYAHDDVLYIPSVRELPDALASLRRTRHVA